MNTWKIIIENLKCGGCEKIVEKVALSVHGVHYVSADAEQGILVVEETDDHNTEKKVIDALRKAGYPPQGESTLRDRAVSYVSCLRGRLSD